MFEHLDDPLDPHRPTAELGVIRRGAAHRRRRARASEVVACAAVLVAVAFAATLRDDPPPTQMVIGPTTTAGDLVPDKSPSASTSTLARPETTLPPPPTSTTTTSIPFDFTDTPPTSPFPSYSAPSTTPASSLIVSFPLESALDPPPELRLTLYVDRTTIRSGESVRGILLVENQGDEPITLRVATTCRVAYGFTAQGAWLGGHLRPMACPPGEHDDVIDAGGHEITPVTFDSAIAYRGFEGPPVPLVTAIEVGAQAGRLVCTEGGGCGAYWSNRIPITIEPEG